MTLDEARQTLKEIRCYPALDDYDKQAVDKAIKILKFVEDVKSIDFDTIQKTVMTYPTICGMLEEVENETDG